MLDARVFPVDEVDFADLVEAVAERSDTQAFAHLYSHYAPRIRYYMHRGGSSLPEAEELTQETLARVWRKAGAYDRRQASVAAWIFTIARNLRTDVYRRDRRPENWAEEYLTVKPEPNTPDLLYDLEEDQIRLQDALQHIPAEQSKVLRMAYFDNLTHVEIATQLQLPLGTVKSRVRLALGRLKRLLS